MINAAGIPFQRGRQRYHAVHADGARAIAEAARAAGVQRLVHISGIGADNRSSKNRYIQSKVAAEDAIIAGFDSATILRPSVVFGPDDAHVQPPRQDRHARRRSCRVVGNGRPRCSRSSPAMSARAAAAVLAQPDTAKSVFELGGPEVYTYREIAALVLREIHRQKPIIGVPAGLMKIAGFFAQQFARSACPADHRRPGRSDEPRQRRAGPAPRRWRPRHRSRRRPRPSCRPTSTASASAAATTSTPRPESSKERTPSATFCAFDN